jgi:Tfp pilus assembly protein PilW
MKKIYKIKKFRRINTGYTLIETMIAISIFIIVVMVGMVALLNANLLYNKSKGMRSIIDSLNFTMDDMSRNLRTGNNYHCIETVSVGDNSIPAIATTSTLSGINCMGIAFNAQDGTQWIYEIFSPSSSISYIRKSTNGLAWVQMTPKEAVMSTSIHPFSILGAEPPPGDTQQPFVTIKLTGDISYQGVISSFSLQTSVSQRQIDI